MGEEDATIDLDSGIGKAINSLHYYLDFNMFRDEEEITIQDNVMARKQKTWSNLKHQKGDHRGADVLKNSLEKFSYDLQEIEKYSEELLNSLTSKWENCKNYENFIGIRFEIEIAALLIRDDFSFQEVDPPDFKIVAPEANLECTTIKAEENNQSYDNINFTRRLREKIIDKIEDSKGKEDYQKLENGKNVLLIDLTNLFIRACTVEERPNLDEELEHAFNQFQRYNWGSLVLVNHAGDQDRKYRREYYRADNSWLDNETKKFLDQCFPQIRSNFKKFTLLAEP